MSNSISHDDSGIEGNSTTGEKLPFLSRMVSLLLRGDVAILLTVVSLLLGLSALILTPREEEPQIVVPIADVFISAPGLSAEEVERQVTERLEKLLYQIDGVEYVYSMSQPGQAVVTVRFYVGENREDSLVKIYNKINSSVDQIPPTVSSWVVKPIEIDDVPIVVASLWSERTGQYSDHELRRIAEEVQRELQSIPNTNRVLVVGGRPRRVTVELDTQRLAAHQTSSLQVAQSLKAANISMPAGQFSLQNEQFLVEAGTFIRQASELENLVVNVVADRPVYMKNVATVQDGPAEAETYSWMGFGAADAISSQADQANSGTTQQSAAANRASQVYPAVHISVAKRKGSNAVWIAKAVQQRLSELSSSHFPQGVQYRITRDYGETADEKVNELVMSLVVAVITVVGLIGMVMGWRPALVVALAIPVCYSITLFVNLLAGYTINRVTMFALILALGLLVDDPITNVENIARYFSMKSMPFRLAVLRAVHEVQPAVIMSTLAIIASFLPLAFITGMMGPYMAPMALNVPLTVTISTFVALSITPWMAMAALKGTSAEACIVEPQQQSKGWLYRGTQLLLNPILRSDLWAWSVLALIGLLMLGAVVPVIMRKVPLKMLPYDNKNEFQIVIDMPEGTTLEKTDAVARRLGRYLSGVAEVRDYQVFVGHASPMDFNGMVRHYFLRQGPHLADIRVNLLHKQQRVQQSHEVLLRIRDDVTRLGQSLGANVKLVEVPPGPPVLSTITAEVYGPPESRYEQLIQVARNVEKRLHQEPGVVDVDVSTEDDQIRYVFETDKPKAALSGISTETIARSVALATSGLKATVLNIPSEVEPLWVELKLPRANRSAIDDLREIYVQGEGGQSVQLGSLGRFVERVEDKTIYHKNLRRVVYVFAEIAGRPPADVIIDVEWDRQRDQDEIAMDAAAEPRTLPQRSWLSLGGGVSWSVPQAFHVNWAGEGEWNITLDVFRDLGLAFAAALVLIYILLMFQTGSRFLPLLLMLAIPLSAIGIVPGFWILNMFMDRPVGGHPNPVFFTATAMIGMIALAGIVIRNSIVLIDFIQMAVDEGVELQEAIVQSVAVRTRPILLTAGTTLLANWVITLDPVFSGLAWAIIFGIFASTLFTVIVIPTVYWLLYRPRHQAVPQ